MFPKKGKIVVVYNHFPHSSLSNWIKKNWPINDSGKGKLNWRKFSPYHIISYILHPWLIMHTFQYTYNWIGISYWYARLWWKQEQFLYKGEMFVWLSSNRYRYRKVIWSELAAVPRCFHTKCKLRTNILPCFLNI